VRRPYRAYGIRHSASLAEMSAETAKSVLATHGGLVRLVLRRVYIPTHLPLLFDRDDLLAVGRLALLQAHSNYDPTRASFTTWACAQIRRAMLDLILNGSSQSRVERKAIRQVRRGCASECESGIAQRALQRQHVPLEDLPAAAEEPEAVFAARAEQRWLAAKLANGLLSERERKIMRRRLRGVSLGEIALEHGVSGERVRQLEGEVLVKLRAAARRDGLISV